MFWTLHRKQKAWHHGAMPKRIKQDNRSKDIIQLANHLVSVSTHEDIETVQPPSKAQISLFMAQLGHRGGKIGGKRRLETMTARQRKTVARKAANARWKKK